MCIAWKNIERGDIVILPESRWSCNWILHLSSIVLRQRLMLSVVRRKQMIGWRTLFMLVKLGNSQLKCSLIREILYSPCRSLLSFSLCLMAIGFLENFPFLPKGSIKSLDIGNGWSDTRSVITLSFSETVLSFRRLCVGWVSKLNRNGKAKVSVYESNKLRWLEPVYMRVDYVFESRFSWKTINLTDFDDFGILKEWWNFKKILFIFLLV